MQENVVRSMNLTEPQMSVFSCVASSLLFIRCLQKAIQGSKK